jgi:cellobionic acid phosphorylase
MFGVSKDVEGRIYLNPQAWAMLGGAASAAQRQKMLNQIEQQLDSPYGVTMFAPPYSAMRDDVGRVTQKHPGSAENGAVYNHASIFYIYSLYTIGEGERAYKALRQMIPGPDEQDYLQRGQLPVFIPNYYRGAHRQYPRTAGRSSQLFNTGTVSWAYRCFIEGLCGLRGDGAALMVQPQLPRTWEQMKVVREFRGATFHVTIRRGDVAEVMVKQDGQSLPSPRVTQFAAGKQIELEVFIPR